MPPLPQLQLLRPGDVLGRVEDNVAKYARELTDERVGLLSHGLTVSANSKGRVYRLEGMKTPDEWLYAGGGQWNFGAGWQQWNDASFGRGGRCAMRKGPDGAVDVVGLWDNITNSSTGTTMAAFPAGSVLAPRAGDFGIQTSNAFMTAGTVIIGNVGVVHNTGTVTQWTSLHGIRWFAADTSPIPWPSTAQRDIMLDRDYPGEPSVVRLEDAYTSDGVHVGPLPVRWKLLRTSGRRVVRIVAIPGLAPLTTYTLELAVLAA